MKKDENKKIKEESLLETAFNLFTKKNYNVTSYHHVLL